MPLPTSRPSHEDNGATENGRNPISGLATPPYLRQPGTAPRVPASIPEPQAVPVEEETFELPADLLEEEPIFVPEGYRPAFAVDEETIEQPQNAFQIVKSEEEPLPEVIPAPQFSSPSSSNLTESATESETDYIDDYEDEDEIERREQIDALSDSAKDNARRLLERIADDESSEVLLNGPNEIMFKVNGQRFYDRNISFEDIETYHAVINSLILYETDTKDRIGKTSHLIEGQLELPDYDHPDRPSLFARVHVLAPPVVKAAKVTIAKKAKNQFQLDDLLNRGAMSPNMAAFMKALARGRATVVFSGLSGSGKTTLLEAMSHHFDENDRAVIVEDTAELRLPLPDAVYLLSTSRKPGQDSNEIVTLEWLVAQANRMRPDRIIVGESRGGEFTEFLSAANSGADGSMTTIHASTPRQTIDKMLSLAMKSATAKNETSVLRDISSTVQIIVQTALVDGRHVISHIEEVSDTVLNNGSGIATTPLFQFERNSGKFVATGRPSDNLQSFLAQRGVKVENNWFARTF